MSLLSRRRRRWHSNAGHGRYQMSYEDPTRPLADAQGSYRTLSSIILSSRSPDSHANKKLAGSISRTSHLQLFRHRATYMTSRVCGMPGSQYIASALSPPALTRDHRFVKYYTLAFLLPFVITHHIRCLYHSHFPPTASIPSYYRFIYNSLGQR